MNQENTIVSANLKQYQQQLEITNSIAQTTGSISQNQVYNAQVQQQSAIARLNNLKQTLPLERSQLQNQIKITKEKNRQQFIEAQNREAQAELALTEAREQFNLARKNDASKEQLEQLKLQVEQSQLNLDRAIDATDNAQFQLDIQDELNQVTQGQFETSKQLEQSSTQIGISKARLAETEAKITREYQLQSRAIEVRNNQEAIRTKELNSIVSFRSGELNLANQLTNSEKEKLKIARQMAALKLNSLKSQIASEAEVLALNQRQAKLQLKAKQDKTAAELDQNKADLLRIQASVDKLKATGASQDQIDAEQATFNAAIAQRQALINRSRAEQDEAKLLKQSQAIARDAFSRSSELNIDTARAEAIASLPEKQRERAAKRLAREFKAKAKVSNVSAGQLSSTISGLSNFRIDVPELKIPKIELPSLDDIKANLDAIVSEFRAAPASAGNALNSFEGEGRKFVIQNLSVDSPINISIDGAQDKEAIAQEVEGVVFNTMTDVMRGVENRLIDTP